MLAEHYFSLVFLGPQPLALGSTHPPLTWEGIAQDLLLPVDPSETYWKCDSSNSTAVVPWMILSKIPFILICLFSVSFNEMFSYNMKSLLKIKVIRKAQQIVLIS